MNVTLLASLVICILIYVYGQRAGTISSEALVARSRDEQMEACEGTAESDAITHAIRAILLSSSDLQNIALQPSRDDTVMSNYEFTAISSTILKPMLDKTASKPDQEDHKA